MKYTLLLLLVLTACRPEPTTPYPICADQATTVADAQRLVAGEWRLVGTEGRLPLFSSSDPNFGFWLYITSDSIRVSEPGQPVKAYGWTIAKASTGDITFQGTWNAQHERVYLPHP